MTVRVDRNRRSTTMEWAFARSGISVRLTPEWMFGKDRNQCSTNTGTGVRREPEYAVITDKNKIDGETLLAHVLTLFLKLDDFYFLGEWAELNPC